jgi:acetyl esterase/lipase
MRLLNVFLCGLVALTLCSPMAASARWEPAAPHRQVPIWPGTPPDAVRYHGSETTEVSKKRIGGKTVVSVAPVSRPTMTVYAPRGKNTGAAVVVFPGGGYQILAIDLEGTEVCDWLNSIGVTAVLLKYRVPGDGRRPKSGAYPDEPQALEDAQRTISLVRHHAAEWHIDPHKIGVVGFSAGGHLCVATSNHFEHVYRAVDPIDRVSCRPDFAMVLYPGHLARGEHQDRLNPDIRVTARTPPTFVVQAKDDPVDPVNNSLVYVRALKKAHVPCEMHLYPHGGHAFGLRRTAQPITAWPDLAARWLARIGML